MRQSTLLLGSAGLTLVVLLAGFLAFRALTGQGGAAALPTPSTGASTQATSSPSIRESASVAATASPSAQPSATVIPSPTPSVTAGPTPIPAAGVTYTLKGNEYEDAQIPLGGTIDQLSGGAIQMTTGTAYSDEMTVTYRLDLPAGQVVKSYVVKVCGTGSGRFWETYGPPGSNPVEYEAAAPAGDGCWHFTGGSMTDTTVLAIIGGGSTMRINRVDYVLTFR